MGSRKQFFFRWGKITLVQLSNDQHGSLSLQFFPNHSHSCLTHTWLEINPADWFLDTSILKSISAPHCWAQGWPSASGSVLFLWGNPSLSALWRQSYVNLWSSLSLSPLGLCTSESQLDWHTLLLASNTLPLAVIRHLFSLKAQTTSPLLAREDNGSWMLDHFPADSLTMWGFGPGPAVPTYLPSLSLPVLVSVFTLLTNLAGVDFLNSGPFWTILPTANQTLYIWVGVGGKKPTAEFSHPVP